MSTRGRPSKTQLANRTHPIARIGQSQPVPAGLLVVTCWCEKDELLVSSDEVLAGLTGSCGRDGCAK